MPLNVSSDICAFQPSPQAPPSEEATLGAQPSSPNDKPIVLQPHAARVRTVSPQPGRGPVFEQSVVQRKCLTDVHWVKGAERMLKGVGAAISGHSLSMGGQGSGILRTHKVLWH